MLPLLVALALPASNSESASPPPTTSSSPTDVVLLPPAAEGDIDPTTRAALTEAIARGLARAGQTTVMSTRSEPCPDQACVAQQMTQTNTAHAVAPRFGADGRDYWIELQLTHANSPERKLEVNDACELCGLNEVVQHAEDVAAGLAQDVLDRDRPARLYVRSDPPQATVLLDGIELGVTPFSAEVAPGAHDVVIRRAGFIDRQREIVAVEGGLARVQETLQPLPAAQRPGRGLHVAAGILDGLGVATIGAGVGLLVLHHRPYQRSCEGLVDPLTGRCRQRYDTVVGGVASLTAGVVALATGIALHVVAARRGQARKSRRRASR